MHICDSRQELPQYGIDFNVPKETLIYEEMICGYSVKDTKISFVLSVTLECQAI